MSADEPEGPGADHDAAQGPLARALVAAGVALSTLPRAVAWLLPVAWCALIFFLSSREVVAPTLGDSVAATFAGNLAHPGAFGILAVLVTCAIAPRARRGGLPWATLTPERGLWVVVLCTLYGFSDELHQSTVEGRDASLLDLLGDAVGATFAVLVIRALTPPGGARGGRRLAGLLAAGLVASVAAAALSTHWGRRHGGGPWPF